MVTFRFYLVSVVAFFLALAVGVVVGSVLDGRIADSLQDRLDRVETSLDETVAAMDDKNREIDDLNAYVDASAPYAVQDELPDTTALIVVEPGVDGAPVEDLVARLRQAGSRVDGVVWLEPSFELSETEQVEQLAAIAGAGGSTPTAVRRSFWSALFESTADNSGDTPDATTTTTTLETTTTLDTTTTTEEPAAPIELFTTSLLTEAEDAGLVRIERIDGTEASDDGGELIVAIVTGTGSTADTPGAPAVELAEESASAGLAATVAEVYIAPPADGEELVERGDLLTDRLGDGPLEFSTVDDLDRLSGRVATVLALSAARDDVFGRFGYGPEADAVLPVWQGP